VLVSLQDLSNNNMVRLFWVPGHCDIKGNEETDRQAWMGSNSNFYGSEPCVPLSALIVRDMNKRWVIDAHSKHGIALNSCRQSKLWIKHPKLQTTKYLLSLLRILVSLIITGHCCLNKHLQIDNCRILFDYPKFVESITVCYLMKALWLDYFILKNLRNDG
jgi:hypothetical protein